MKQLVVSAALATCLLGSATAADSLEAIQSEFNRTLRRSGGALKETQLVDFTDRCFNLALEDENARAAALTQVLTICNYGEGEEIDAAWAEAVEILAADYLDEPELAPVVIQLAATSGPRRARAAAQLAEIKESSASVVVQAAVAFGEAQTLLEKYNYGGGLTDAELKQCIALLEQAKASLGDVRDAYGRPAREEAERSLFELQNLGIGCTAPEILGQDLDGIDCKLSDYRGRVVMLDFWGHW